MGILSRFKEIMSSNVNAALDKMEDPSKMVDQLLRNLNDDLGKVKAEAAGVIAEEKRSQRELDDCTANIDKMQTYAQRAVAAGNDNDAKEFLKQKASLVTKQQGLRQAYEAAKVNADKMRAMHDKLVEQINDLNARRDSIKAKVAVAKTQSSINKIGQSYDSAKGNLSAFDRMDEKASRMLDEANAMDELNRGSSTSVDDLKSKYESDTSSIDDELASLKANVNKGKEAPPAPAAPEDLSKKYDNVTVNVTVDDELASLKEKLNKE